MTLAILNAILDDLEDKFRKARGDVYTQLYLDHRNWVISLAPTLEGRAAYVFDYNGRRIVTSADGPLDEVCWNKFCEYFELQYGK
jgi:hypothetical protein